MRVTSLIPLVLTAVALSQCSSGPPVVAEYPLQTGDDVAIVYEGGGAALALQNQSSPGAGQQPADPRVATKVAPDVLIQRLLGLWQREGYFDAATPAVHPQAKASLVLVVNSKRYVCSRLPLQISSVEEVQRFQGFAEVFRAVYDNTETFQASTLDADDLKRENLQLRGEQSELSERLERLQQEAKQATTGRGNR